jgi:hypothetical protein
MKKLFPLMCIFLFHSFSYAQKGTTRAFTSFSDADSVYAACTAVLKDDGFEIKKYDGAGGIIEADKTEVNDLKNGLFFLLSTKKYENGTYAYFATISRKGKSKADTEALVEEFIHNVSIKGKLNIIRFGKNYRE